MVTLGTLTNGRGGRLALAAFVFVLIFAAVPWMHDGSLLRWAVLWSAALVGSLWLLWKAPRLDRIDIAAIAIAAWAAASVYWTPDRFEGAAALSGFAPVVVLFLVLRRIGNAETIVLAGVTATAVAMMVGYVPFGGFGNQNFLTEFLLIAAAVSFGTLSAWAIVPFAVAISLFLPGYLEWPVLAVWFVILLSRLGRFYAPLATGMLILAAFVALGESVELRTAIGTRADLWIGTVMAYLDAPLFGHGLGSFGYIFPAYANAGGLILAPAYSVESATYPGASHNDFLQLGMELGLVGFAIGTWLVFEVWRGAPGLRRVALGTIAVLACIGFPFQNPATAVLIALAASASASPPMWRLPRLVPLAAVAGLAYLLLFLPARVEAQKHLSAALRYLQPEIIELAGSPAAALGHVNAAYQLDTGHRETRLLLFKTAALVDLKERGSLSLEQIETTWTIAQSASPLDPSLLFVRLAYLERYGACPHECTWIVDALLQTAWRKQEVRWLTEKLKENA